MESAIKEKLTARFLVIDGPDGAGKTTQLGLLAEWLAGYQVEVAVARDPGGTPIGDRIRDILLDRVHDEMAVACETLLYMASRAQLVREVIRPALARGACVLCDRYISSTIAYQGAAGADIKAIQTISTFAVGGLRPDLTLLIDVPANVGLARLSGSPDRMEAKGLDFHQAVRQAFLDQAAETPNHFSVIDGHASPDEVHGHVIRALTEWQPARQPCG